MTRIYILTIFILNIAFSNEEFLMDKYDYGRALYDNPRGISCKNCHKATGKEQIFMTYTKRNKVIKVKSKDISKISLKEFSKKLNANPIGIMPKYYLSDDEIASIYHYLTNKE